MLVSAPRVWLAWTQKPAKSYGRAAILNATIIAEPALHPFCTVTYLFLILMEAIISSLLLWIRKPAARRGKKIGRWTIKTSSRMAVCKQKATSAKDLPRVKSPLLMVG